jgi:GAF domain-containing protein
LLRSLGVAVVAYGAALLGAEVSQLRELGGVSRLGAHFFFVVLIATVAVYGVRLFGEGPNLQLQQRAVVLATAHSQVDSYVAEELNRFDTVADADPPALVPHNPVAGIQALVTGMYTCVDSHYSASDVPGERVNFEVTFMTKDPTDGAITILAWASRDGRAPKSLSEQVSRRNIYDTTVTADLYRAAATRQPSTRIIATTTNDYSELYPGQKDRIRSSIVHPVLSGRNVLLGTLVVHCDSENFFRSSDEKYWRDLLEIFAKRIALEKTRLDWLQHAGPTDSTVEPS